MTSIGKGNHFPFYIQLDRKTGDLNNLRIELEEKRAECLKLKTQLQEMDEKFFDSQAKTKEEIGRALRVRHHTLCGLHVVSTNSKQSEHFCYSIDHIFVWKLSYSM